MNKIDKYYYTHGAYSLQEEADSTLKNKLDEKYNGEKSTAGRGKGMKNVGSTCFISNMVVRVSLS